MRHGLDDRCTVGGTSLLLGRHYTWQNDQLVSICKPVHPFLMKLPPWLVGEILGTFIIVFFGCGAVAAAVLTGAQVGVFQVAIVWGLAVTTAIYLAGSLSGAHLNPAVTVSLAAWSGFPISKVLPYLAAQMVGAFIGAATVFFIFGDAFQAYELKNQIIRSQPGGEATAMIFGEFFPSPGGKPLDATARMVMTWWPAFGAEVIATAMLLIVILGTTDDRNNSRPQILTAATIGLTVTLLISLIGPLTGCCLNPARDLAPRIFSSLAGWGSVPFSTNGHGWLSVYVVAPLIGGILGGAVHRFILKPAFVRAVQ